MEVILADEPTGNLDTKTGNRIMELLKRSNKNIGTTIIFVTHDEKMALFAERKIVLDNVTITSMYVKWAKT